METIRMDNSFAGTHIDSACQAAIDYGTQDVEVAFIFNDTEARARKGDTVDIIRDRWDADMNAKREAYLASPEYKERTERETAELAQKTNAVMKETATSEAGMRAAKVPWPYTMKQLTDYVESLTSRQHDYGTCVYAMSMAAVAAYNYASRQLGATGFQASCADLDILRRTRSIKGPFAIFKAEDALYPQYDLPGKLTELLESAETRKWLREEAAKLLAESSHAHPKVIAHWKKLAADPELATDAEIRAAVRGKADA